MSNKGVILSFYALQLARQIRAVELIPGENLVPLRKEKPPPIMIPNSYVENLGDEFEERKV